MWRGVVALLLGALAAASAATTADGRGVSSARASTTAGSATPPTPASTAPPTAPSTAAPSTAPPVPTSGAPPRASTSGSSSTSAAPASSTDAHASSSTPGAAASEAAFAGTTGGAGVSASDAWTTWDPTTAPGAGTSAAAAAAASSSSTDGSTPAAVAPAAPPPALAETHARPGAHGFPSRLLEKLAALSCDIPPLPGESRLWRGNETHELTLPILAGEPACGEGAQAGEDGCPPLSVSWEGAAELQAGDVLIVRIDDARLRAAAGPRQAPADRRRPRVFAVARAGRERCDTAAGALLDITPLAVEGRHVLTLYDKDLTDGLNLLIVTSDLWGGRCVQLRVLVKSDNCGDGQDCSGKGVCFSNTSMEGYECQCCPGFVGPHCEERDACFPSPCRNHGICVDLSQGHEGATYQCLCPYGFTGKRCEREADPCSSTPCLNGGSCTRNGSRFSCACAPGFAGATCQHNLNECESSPCRHGICVDEDGGYRCFCRPGFTGQNCEFEYNECESSPCVNGGTCLDRVGRYACVCGRGYGGKRCHLKIDLCDPNPCRAHHLCVDRGNNYSCECPHGYAGPDCLVPSRAACSVNPCRHGGTCWSSVDSFYCACRPGYTGATCDEEFVLESIPSALPAGPPGAPLDLTLAAPAARLGHLHHVYIAAGTLACAVVIVALTVAACHCRVHETYKRCLLGAPGAGLGFGLLTGAKARGGGGGAAAAGSADDLRCTRPGHTAPPHSSRGGGRGPAAGGEKGAGPNRSLPALEAADLYYTLDFSDSQSSPLIQ